MLSRAYASLLHTCELVSTKELKKSVNALTGLCLIATVFAVVKRLQAKGVSVSMPSRAYASLLLPAAIWDNSNERKKCQCPHGLMPHCYSNRISERRKELYMCQCPHGLMPHCYKSCLYRQLIRRNVSMPSRAYASLLLRINSAPSPVSVDVSMPSRAYASLLQLSSSMKKASHMMCQCPHGLMPHCY